MIARALQVGTDAMGELLDGDYPEWIAEAYGASGIGVGGTALFVLFMGALGLYNWSETFKVPAVWLVLMTPLVAGLLPVPVVWRLAGLITTALATLFLGLWVYWNRV